MCGIVLLEDEVDGHGVGDSHSLAALAARGPFGHGLYYSYGLTVEVRIEWARDFDVGYGAVGHDDELDEDASLDAVLLSDCRVFDGGGEELSEFGVAAGEYWHLLDDDEDFRLCWFFLLDDDGLEVSDFELGVVVGLGVVELEILVNLGIVVNDGDGVGHRWWWRRWWGGLYLILGGDGDHLLFDHLLLLLCDVLNSDVLGCPFEGRQCKTKSRSKAYLGED